MGKRKQKVGGDELGWMVVGLREQKKVMMGFFSSVPSNEPNRIHSLHALQTLFCSI